ncbi:MAG: hypothetical protein ACRCW0_06320 [Clostridium sp.]
MKGGIIDEKNNEFNNRNFKGVIYRGIGRRKKINTVRKIINI